MHNHSLRHILHAVTATLEKKQVDSPRLSAEVLIAFALGKERNELLKDLILHPSQPLADTIVQHINALTARRASGEPIAYIVGSKEFYGRPFAVSPDTLIPRPETELLIEEACQFAGEWQKKHTGPYTFADLGTGSGCIGVTLGAGLPHWQGVLVDKSAEALEIAQKNAQVHKAHNVQCVLGDFCLSFLQPQSLAMCITNPPYISEAEYRELCIEVKHFEPKSALVPDLFSEDPHGGATGLEHAVRLVDIAAASLCSGGLFLMEIGCDQKEAVQSLFSPTTWHIASVKHDLAGLPRYARAIRL